MPGSGDPVNSFVPSVSVGSLNPGANTQTGSALLGNLGGRLMKYSSHRGGAQPPAHVTRRCVVYDYYNGSEGGDAYIDVSTTNAAGGTTYLGPLFESNLVLSYNKWFPSSDWTRGLVVYFYDESATDSGSAGQYVFVKGRASDNPNRLLLYYPLPIAPQAGDKFVIGGQLAWITFKSVKAPLFSGHLQARRYELDIQQREGSSSIRLEFYPSGESFIPAAQLFPYKAGAIYVELTEAERESRGIYAAGLIDSSGQGTTGHEIRPAIANIIEKGEDYLIDAVNIEYVLTQ